MIKITMSLNFDPSPLPWIRPKKARSSKSRTPLGNEKSRLRKVGNNENLKRSTRISGIMYGQTRRNYPTKGENILKRGRTGAIDIRAKLNGEWEEYRRKGWGTERESERGWVGWERRELDKVCEGGAPSAWDEQLNNCERVGAGSLSPSRSLALNTSRRMHAQRIHYFIARKTWSRALFLFFFFSFCFPLPLSPWRLARRERKSAWIPASSRTAGRVSLLVRLALSVSRRRGLFCTPRSWNRSREIRHTAYFRTWASSYSCVSFL